MKLIIDEVGVKTKMEKNWNKIRIGKRSSLRDRPKIFVGMSGGVDSSVTAALLKNAATPDEFEKLIGRPIGDGSSGYSPTQKGFRGFDVTGVHIKMWSDPEIPCTFKEDRYDAMRVCAHLGIPFETWDFTEEYKTQVVEYMIREYAAGRTPNPDVMCNRYVKFGIFLKRALERGADFIATGHYVRLSANNESKTNKRINEFVNSRSIRYSLIAAKDINKDQSYFLWTLTQERLEHCLFPIGEFTKPHVREIARKFGLHTAEKKDSQGICFIGEIDVREFLKKHILMRPGLVRTGAGKIVGEHEGLSFYTIGQREGLGIGGGIPYYVVKKDFKRNALVVAEGPYGEKLFSRNVLAQDIHWISGEEPKLPLQCTARIRYRQPVQHCRVEPLTNADETRTHAENSASVSVKSAQVRVVFDELQRAVTPGQSIVFYKRDEMLGGGIIFSHG